MSTNLIPLENEPIKWKFPEDFDDPDACIFHIQLRTNRSRLETQLKKAAKLMTHVEDYAADVYGNIVKIENADGKTLTDIQDIVNFCLDRLSENQGSTLQLAIQNFDNYLTQGLVKN